MSEENKGGQEAPKINVEEIEAKVRAQLQSEFEEEKAKIIHNRDEILAEKKELQDRFKGVDPDKLAQFQEFQSKIEKDELLRLASEGKVDQLSEQIMSGQRAAWDEQVSEYETRLEASSGKIGELENMVNELRSQNVNMQKNQYLKELTSTDETFKSDYFGHFVKLYSDRMDIDEKTGNVYALDDRGKRMVDANGELESFNSFYNRQKIKDGLFWTAGSGSGQLSGGDGEGRKPLSQMTLAEKSELRKEMGDKAYFEMVAKQK